jgi:hypothetical protein
MVTWTATSILAALSPAAKAAIIPKEDGRMAMEAILRGTKPGGALGVYLGKHTSAAVPHRLVDRVIASLLLVGVVDHGLAVGDTDVSVESEVGVDLLDHHPDPLSAPDTSSSLDMSSVDTALAAAVRASGAMAEIGRAVRRVATSGGDNTLPPRNLPPQSQQVDNRLNLSQMEAEAAERRRKREKLTADLLAAEEEERVFLAEESRRRSTSLERGGGPRLVVDLSAPAAGGRDAPAARKRQQTLTPEGAVRKPTAAEKKAIEEAEQLALKELERTRKEAGMPSVRLKVKKVRGRSAGRSRSVGATPTEDEDSDRTGSGKKRTSTGSRGEKHSKKARKTKKSKSTRRHRRRSAS